MTDLHRAGQNLWKAVQNCTAQHPSVASVALWTSVQLCPDCSDGLSFADVRIQDKPVMQLETVTFSILALLAVPQRSLICAASNSNSFEIQMSLLLLNSFSCVIAYIFISGFDKQKDFKALLEDLEKW